MANNNFKPALTSDSRVFIAPTGAASVKTYEYHSCMRLDGLSKSYGEATPVYCPDPKHAGKFEEIATIEGADTRWTSSLIGRLPIDYQSILSKLASARCSFDVQVHFGKCVDPSNFNTFSMAWVFENVQISSYDLGALGALSPDERATIDETVAFSAQSAYQLFQNYPYQYGQEVTSTGSIAALTYSPNQECEGDCLETCANFYGIKLPATPLVSQDVYITHTHDGGLTWEETLLPCSATYATAPYTSYNIVSDGFNLYVVLNEVGGGGHLYVVPTEQVDANAITTTYYSALADTTIYAIKLIEDTLWLAGFGGKIWSFNRNTLILTTVLNATLTTSTFYAMDAVDNNTILAGGALGDLVLRRNGGSFQAVDLQVATVPVTNSITAIVMKSETEWIIGTDAGKLYSTIDGGVTFTLLSSFVSCISKINFSTKSAGYLVLKDPAQIWRTYDGGATWNRVDDKYAQLPINAELFGIEVCETDPNTFIAYGRVPNATVVNPCSPTLLYTTGDVGAILVGKQ